MHRAQIEFNHVDTLENLSANGGLDWYELLCGLTDRPLFPYRPITDAAARDRVIRIIGDLAMPYRE